MAEMKRLVFGKGLMEPSLDGSKRFTIRKYDKDRHSFKKGEVVIGEFMDGLDILITITEDTIIDTFFNLRRSRRQMKAHGGHHFDEMYFKELEAYYPGLTWSTQGAVIFFEVAKIKGVPAVSRNKRAK